MQGPAFNPQQAMDLGGTIPRDPNSPSKTENFRILALNIAMGVEQGRVSTAQAGHGDVLGNATDILVGDMARVLKDAEAVYKFINTGH